MEDESTACSLYLLMLGGTKQAPMPTVSREVDGLTSAEPSTLCDIDPQLMVY